MPAPLLSLTDLHLTFGGHPLLDGAELFVHPGERLCLVGRNGSGKSTLLKIAAGQIEPDRGQRILQQGTALRYLPQEPDLSGFATTHDYVAAGLSDGDSDHRAQRLLERLGLTGFEDPAHLSGGEARRAALARVLAPATDLILLDEPTNHLDLPAIEWLESELASRKGAMVLISHDRRFLERLSQATLWLDRGQVRRLDKGFAAFEAWRDQILEDEERDRHKLARRIVAEEHWLRYGVTARRKRNERRVEQLHSLRRQLVGERRVAAQAQGQVQLTASEGARSGKLVVEAKGLSKSYGERAIVRDLSLKLPQGARLGIVGPNGAGKTTLVKLLTGALAPDEGTLRLGARVELATLDQGRASLPPEMTLQEAVTEGRGDSVLVGGQSRHVMSYLQDFLFTPQQAGQPLKALSGGERGRLMLARALTRPANLLVLDEPTNDLDLDTLELLQELLADYAGTVLLVSHDRDFLDRVCTSLLVYEGKGKWQEYAGGYTDMVAQRGRGVQALEKAKTQPPTLPSPAGAGEGSTPSPVKRGRVGEGGSVGSIPKRLTPAERHALSELPRRMETLQKGIAGLAAKLALPSFHAGDPAVAAKAGADLAKLQAALDAAEEEWLRLTILKEEIEG